MAIALRQGKHTAGRVASRLRRQVRGRKRVAGSAERPRLVVTRSSKHITAQDVDDRNPPCDQKREGHIDERTPAPYWRRRALRRPRSRRPPRPGGREERLPRARRG